MVEGGCWSWEARARPAPVHVVDDEEEVCWGIATLLISAGHKVETHPSGLAFLDALPGLPDGAVGCVLTDVRMPGLDGLQLLGCLRKRGFSRPVVVMTAHGDISMAVRAMKAGAFDFVEKPFGDEALLAIVAAALDGPGTGREAAAARSPATSPTTSHGRMRPMVAEAAARLAALSPREREVLALSMEGKPGKIVAFELGISPRTVEVHRTRLMARLQVGSLVEAARLAVWAELAGDGSAAPASLE